MELAEVVRNVALPGKSLMDLAVGKKVLIDVPYIDCISSLFVTCLHN